MNRRGNRGASGCRGPERQSLRRGERTTVLIVCEGRETEANYFDELKRMDVVAGRFSVKIVPGYGGSRQQIVQRAVNLMQQPNADFDEVWCVMDTERLDNAETRQDYRAALRIADSNGIIMVLSNPAFEVWFLAHFVRTSRSFKDCEAVVVELNKRWNTHFKKDYEKSDPRVHALLADKLPSGLENARFVREQDHPDKPDIADCNSSTEVYKLVGHLISN